MSLLIKGMDMPKKDAGVFCRLYRYKDGTAQFTQYGRTSFDQPDNHYFRAVEIPTPHGNLIDRDDLLAYFERQSKGKTAEEALKLLYTALKAYPTVIEKENKTCI